MDDEEHTDVPTKDAMTGLESDELRATDELAFDWGEDADASEGEEPDVLRFDVGGLSFAVEAMHVFEVAPAPQLTPIPGLPNHVVGVAVRRRHVLSVVDFAIFLGLPKQNSANERLIVFNVDGLEVGAIVPATHGLEVWPEDADAPEPTEATARVRKYTLGAHWAPGGRVLLLDLPELLRAAAVT